MAFDMLLTKLSTSDLLHELYSQLSPTQFENFLSNLLDEMGFSDINVIGRSGDRGIDLEATWTEENVPGLQVDLAFKIPRARPGYQVFLNYCYFVDRLYENCLLAFLSDFQRFLRD
jgi:hypothetical protein